MATMTQAQILRTLAELTNFKGDDGLRDAVLESLDALDPGDDEVAGDDTTATSSGGEGASSPTLAAFADGAGDAGAEAPATGRRRST